MTPPDRAAFGADRGRRGLTLLEILVAATIIAVLAIAGAAQYQRAATRSMVSRAMADLHALRGAIEVYSIDHNEAPMLDGGVGLPGALRLLLRPREYITAVPLDPFCGREYHYLAVSPREGLPRPYFDRWIVSSVGPDQTPDTQFSGTILYDPTNGSFSRGDLVEATVSASAMAAALP